MNWVRKRLFLFEIVLSGHEFDVADVISVFKEGELPLQYFLFGEFSHVYIESADGYLIFIFPKDVHSQILVELTLYDVDILFAPFWIIELRTHKVALPV
jgi:hypothetical protein